MENYNNRGSRCFTVRLLIRDACRPAQGGNGAPKFVTDDPIFRHDNKGGSRLRKRDRATRERDRNRLLSALGLGSRLDQII